MRYYLILEKSPKQAARIQELFSGLDDFHCLAVIHSLKDTFQGLLSYTPELVIINLDNYESNLPSIITRIKKSYGLMPKLIGITTSYRNGYEALKSGFLEVIGPDMQLAGLRPKLLEYGINVSRNLFCIPSYQDFRYVCLKNLILLRADNTTTDFILNDGICISGLNTLKHYAPQLPKNFLRVHRSYIVNAYSVRRINYLKNQIQLSVPSHQIPFTRHYLDNVDRLKIFLTEC